MRPRAVVLTITFGLALGVAASSWIGVVAARHTVTLPRAADASTNPDPRPDCPPDAPWSDEAAACFAPPTPDASTDAAAGSTSSGAPPAEPPNDDAGGPPEAGSTLSTPPWPTQPPVPAPADDAPLRNAPDAPASAGDAAVIPDPLPMVVRQPDGRRLVRRDAVEAFLRDESAVRRNAPQRTVPHHEDGVLIGYRLEGLGLGSVYTDLGIRDGDTIVRVNGTFIDSPQRGWALFAGLQQTESFVVEVRRRGHDRVLRFDVVDDDGMRAWFEGSGDVPF